MWPNALTQLFEARFIALAAIALLTVWGLLKRKAIGAMSSAVWRATTDWLWTNAEKKLAERRAPDTTPPERGRPQGSYEKTYRGIFESYNQFENPPRDHFFQLKDSGTTITVPVARTNLFSHVRRGQKIEVETRVGVYYDCEVVERVRVEVGF
jgi:hypothetical protein